MLGTLFCESDSILYEYASNRNGRVNDENVTTRAERPLVPPPRSVVLLTVGSARLKFVAEFLN